MVVEKVLGMEKRKYIIIGAGPSGLAFAVRLMQRGENDFLLLESEDSAGGLCRSEDVDGSPLEISGGHFLDVKRRNVLDLVSCFMPLNEWDRYERITRIFIHGREIGSPVESFIWQMPEEVQERYLRDIAEAGSNNGAPMPEKFVDWIYWKLGKSIAEDYMLPYNRKLFGENLDLLGTYWLEKLPSVSYEETMRSCREKRFFGKQPAHAQFFYPKKHGYGEVWRRMGASLGDRLILGEKAESVDCARRIVNGKYVANCIVNTAPWTSFGELSGITDRAADIVRSLMYSSVDVDYVPDNLDTEAQWIYYPDPELSYHRILVRHNFCPGARGYWTETNSSRAKPLAEGAFRHTSKYAYPLNTIGKNEAMTELLAELKTNSVHGLGRWGEWQHYNSDVVVERALALADSILDGRR